MNGLIVALRDERALGIFNQVYAFYIVLSQIAVGGVHHSVLQKVSYSREDLELIADSTASALIIVTTMSTIVVLGALALAGPAGRALQSEAITAGLRYVLPGLVFFGLNKALLSVLNGLQQMRVYAVFRALRFVFIPAFMTWLLLTGAPAARLPLALTLSEALLFALMFAFIYLRLLPLRPPSGFVASARAHLSYGARGLFSGVLLEMNTRVDVLMLGLFVSDAVVGVYSFAAILAEGYAQVPIAVRYNIDPLLGQHFAADDRPAIRALAARVRRPFIALMTAGAVIGIAVYPFLYRALVGEADLAVSWTAFGVLIGANLLVAGYSPLRGVLLQGGAPGAYTLIILATVVLNIILNATLLPFFGMVGAATATGAAIIAEIALLVIVARRLLDVRL